MAGMQGRILRQDFLGGLAVIGVAALSHWPARKLPAEQVDIIGGDERYDIIGGAFSPVVFETNLPDVLTKAEQWLNAA